MRLNPFSVDTLKDLLVFHEKNDFMFLKIYQIKRLSDLNGIIAAVNEKLGPFNDLYYTLNIHYDGKQQSLFFSINTRWDGDFYTIDEVESRFHELTARLAGLVADVQNPYSELYFHPFHGSNNFVARLLGNVITLYEPSTKNVMQSIAVFEVNLHNFKIFPGFFKLVDDLALKMKVKINIDVMFKKENKQYYMDAYFTISEQKEYIFREILEKIKGANEFTVILRDRQVRKCDIVELFIKRKIKNQAGFISPDAVHFFTTHVVQRLDDERGLPPADPAPLGRPSSPDAKDPGSTGKTNAGGLGLLSSLSLGPINEHAMLAFHEIIGGEGGHGIFLDQQGTIYDDGSRIYAVVHGLSIKGLHAILQRFVNKRTFRLLFVDPCELAEFNQRLPPSLERVYETAVLADTLPREGLGPQLLTDP